MTDEYFSSDDSMPSVVDMEILIVGAHGTIGTAVTEHFRALGHSVTTVGRTRGDIRCDMADDVQLEAMWRSVGRTDAVVCAAGEVPFAPFEKLTTADFADAWNRKALAQINLVRMGVDNVAPDGSFALISGIPSRDPVMTGTAAATVNGAVEAFVRAAAIEIAPQRINVVSPSVLTESLHAFDASFPGFPPVDAADIVRAFRKCVEGGNTGKVIELP